MNRNAAGGYALGILYLIICGAIWCATAEVVQYIYTDYAFECPFLVTYLGGSIFLLHFPLHFFHTRFNTHEGDDDLHRHVVVRREEERGDVEAGVVVANPLHKGRKARRSNNNKSNSIISNNDNSSHRKAIKVSIVLAPVWFVANLCYSYALLLTSVTSSVIISNLAASFALIFAYMAGLEQITKTKIIGIVLAFAGALIVSFQDLEFSSSSSSSSSHGLGDGVAFLSSIGYGLYLTLLRLLVPADTSASGASVASKGEESPRTKTAKTSKSSRKGGGKRRRDGTKNQRSTAIPPFAKQEAAVSMQLVFAYLGLLLAVCLLPVVIVVMLLHLDNIYFSVLTDDNAKLLFVLLLCAYFDQFVADYLWASASTLTSPSVAALGQGITIPLAFFADMALKKEGSGQALSAIGATLVCIGFAFANAPSRSSSTSTSRAMLPVALEENAAGAGTRRQKRIKIKKKSNGGGVLNPLHINATQEQVVEEQEREHKSVLRT